MKSITAVALLALATFSFSQEKITLDAPLQVVSDPGSARWRVCSLLLNRIPVGITIRLCECDSSGAFIINANGAFVGRSATFTYGDNATTATMLSGLNTANLSIKSLERRIIERLQTDGNIGTGIFSGTP